MFEKNYQEKFIENIEQTKEVNQKNNVEKKSIIQRDSLIAKSIRRTLSLADLQELQNMKKQKFLQETKDKTKAFEKKVQQLCYQNYDDLISDLQLKKGMNSIGDKTKNRVKQAEQLKILNARKHFSKILQNLYDEQNKGQKIIKYETHNFGINNYDTEKINSTSFSIQKHRSRSLQTLKPFVQVQQQIVQTPLIDKAEIENQQFLGSIQRGRISYKQIDEEFHLQIQGFKTKKEILQQEKQVKSQKRILFQLGDSLKRAETVQFRQKTQIIPRLQEQKALTPEKINDNQEIQQPLTINSQRIPSSDLLKNKKINKIQQKPVKKDPRLYTKKLADQLAKSQMITKQMSELKKQSPIRLRGMQNFVQGFMITQSMDLSEQVQQQSQQNLSNINTSQNIQRRQSVQDRMSFLSQSQIQIKFQNLVSQYITVINETTDFEQITKLLEDLSQKIQNVVRSEEISNTQTQKIINLTQQLLKQAFSDFKCKSLALDNINKRYEKNILKELYIDHSNFMKNDLFSKIVKNKLYKRFKIA